MYIVLAKVRGFEGMEKYCNCVLKSNIEVTVKWFSRNVIMGKGDLCSSRNYVQGFKMVLF